MVRTMQWFLLNTRRSEWRIWTCRPHNPNVPKCIYFYPRLTGCHSHPHIWQSILPGVLWAGSSGHKTEGRLGSKLQRLDLPAAWHMGCCAVWSWFGILWGRRTITAPAEEQRSKGDPWHGWQDMARYGKIWQDTICFYNTLWIVVSFSWASLSLHTDCVKRGGRRNIDLSTLKRDHMIQAYRHTPCLLHSFMVWL